MKKGADDVLVNIVAQLMKWEHEALSLSLVIGISFLHAKSFVTYK